MLHKRFCRVAARGEVFWGFACKCKSAKEFRGFGLLRLIGSWVWVVFFEHCVSSSISLFGLSGVLGTRENCQDPVNHLTGTKRIDRSFHCGGIFLTQPLVFKRFTSTEERMGSNICTEQGKFVELPPL